MESTEIKLLHQLIKSREAYQAIVDRSVKSDLFIELEEQIGNNTHKLLFTIATHYFQQYKNPITREAIIRYMSVMHLSDTVKSEILGMYDIASMCTDESPIHDLIDYLKKQYRDHQFKKILIEGSECFNNNKVTDGVSKLRAKLFELDMVTSDYTSGALLNNDVESRIIQAQTERPDGVKIGFPTFDRATMGLTGGQLMIVASGTGEGKSPFCINAALNAWRNHGANVLFITIENYKHEVIRRIDSAATGIPQFILKKGNISDRDKQTFIKWSEECKSRKNIFHIEERLVDCTPEFLESKLNEIFPQKYDLVVVDYLQLMTLGGGDTNKDQMNMYYGELVQQVRSVARKNNVPIITPSQINRSGKKGKDEKNSDMYDSYSDAFSQVIANTADIRLSLKAVDPDMYYDSAGLVDLKAVFTKHRDGPKSKFIIKADFARMKMVECVSDLEAVSRNFDEAGDKHAPEFGFKED